MMKSIGRTLAQIDVAANTSVRIHEDFFNSHSSYHQLSQNATTRASRLSTTATNSAALCPSITGSSDRLA